MLDDLGPLTILVGPNAVGKTNVIEGIQLLTSATSFRHPKVEHLVRSQADSAHVTGLVTDGQRELDLALDVSEGKRHHTLNGKAKRPVDLKGLIPSVVFTPDDLEFVKGPRSVRLAELDMVGSQLSSNHYLIKRDYEKVVRYKNRLLKEEASDDLIASIDEMLVTCGAQLTCYRYALFEKIVPYIVSSYESLSEGRESFSAFYLPSWKVGVKSAFHEGSTTGDGKGIEFYQEEQQRSCPSLSRDEAREALSQDLVKRSGEERARRRSLVGPHADQFGFFIDGRDAATFGSQGQQRSIVLAFKLAETAIIRDMLGQSPLVLLDDVMSELDENRREALMSFISNGMQTFVTTTNLSYFKSDVLADARVVELCRGVGDSQGSPHHQPSSDPSFSTTARGNEKACETEEGEASNSSEGNKGNGSAAQEGQQRACSPSLGDVDDGRTQMTEDDGKGRGVSS